VQPHRVTSTRVVYENRWMRVHEDLTERPDGVAGLYAWIEKPPAALIVPLDGSDVWLISQWRHPLGARFFEFPQGAWEDSPDAPGESLARGELVEETGLRAAAMERLGRLYFAYGITNQPVDIWLATGLEPGPAQPEDTEHDLRCERFPVAELEAMIRRGEVCDAASVGAWHLVTTR
jgi:8-oxo-dGTP pyrophosphatase MutT (NUDIX family)